MSTQRWFIVALSVNVIQQTIEVAQVFRDALREDKPLVQKPIPSAENVFARVMTHVTRDHRAIVLKLLDFLLTESDRVNCYVFSETDNELVAAWRGFRHSPKNSKTLRDLPEGATASEILTYIQDKAGATELCSCYWCEKPAHQRAFYCVRSVCPAFARNVRVLVYCSLKNAL